MTKTKKSLWISSISLLVCCVFLIGTTFAWFTDSVTSGKNRIQAGNLDIDLLMDKQQSGTYESIANGTGDIFSEKTGNGIHWEPGKTEIVYLAVQNKGSLALNYNIVLNITDGTPVGLVGALEYAVLDGKTAADLSAVTSWTDLLAMPDVQTGDIAARETVAAPNGTLDEIALSGEQNETDYFALAVHMKEDASNDFQNGSITIDVNVVAKQAAAETDSFDDQYDKQASYTVNVSNENEFLSAIENGQNILLTDSIMLNQGVTLNNPCVIYMNGNDLTLSNGTGSIKTMDTLTVEGNGTIKGALVVNQNAKLTINAGDTFVVDSNFVTGAAISTGLYTTVEINGGTYTNNQKGGAAVINFLGSNLTMRNATVNVGIDSASQCIGINSANAKTTMLENVTVNARYSIAVQLNNAMSGHATIVGGEFTTDKIAVGWNPNPTIKYGGTLDISDATINRVGVGILYKTFPTPTEVVGLNANNLTFNPLDAAASAYQDIAYQ